MAFWGWRHSLGSLRSKPRSRLRRTASALALALGVLAIITLASCSLGGPPQDGGSFDTLKDLRDAYVNAGGKCPHFDENDKVTLASQSGSCSDSTTLELFLSKAKRDDQVQTYKHFSSMGITVHILVGANWIVNDDHGTSKYVKKMGGQLINVKGDD